MTEKIKYLEAFKEKVKADFSKLFVENTDNSQYRLHGYKLSGYANTHNMNFGLEDFIVEVNSCGIDSHELIQELYMKSKICSIQAIIKRDYGEKEKTFYIDEKSLGL